MTYRETIALFAKDVKESETAFRKAQDDLIHKTGFLDPTLLKKFKKTKATLFKSINAYNKILDLINSQKFDLDSELKSIDVQDFNFNIE